MQNDAKIAPCQRQRKAKAQCCMSLGLSRALILPPPNLMPTSFSLLLSVGGWPSAATMFLGPIECGHDTVATPSLFHALGIEESYNASLTCIKLFFNTSLCFMLSMHVCCTEECSASCGSWRRMLCSCSSYCILTFA